MSVALKPMYEFHTAFESLDKDGLAFTRRRDKVAEYLDRHLAPLTEPIDSDQLKQLFSKFLIRILLDIRVLRDAK